MSQERLLNENRNDHDGIRFQRVQIEQIYYKDWLNEEFKNARYPLPEDIKKARNWGIIMSAAEFVCSLLSIGFYEKRRSRLILAITIFNFIFVSIGFRAKMKLSYCGLIAHSTYMISIIGGFYLYILIQNAMGSDKQKGRGHGKESLSSTTVLILGSLPMLLLFIMGNYSLNLFLKVDEELEARQMAEQGDVE